MTSKCGKNKKVAHEAIAECAFFLFLPHFDVIYDLLLNRRTPKWNLFVLYNSETNYYTKLTFVYFETSQHNMKAGLCPAFAHFGKDEKPFDVRYYLYKLKQFHRLLCVAKNCDGSRKITSLSNLTRASLLVEWKLTARKAELNCEIYKSWRKCCKHQVSFCHRSRPMSRKAWRCLENCRSWKNTLRKLAGAVNQEAIWFEFWMKRE